MKPSTRYTLFTLCPTLLLLPNLCYADDKIYPGASCHPFDIRSAQYTASLPQQLSNSSDELNISVTCPIIRGLINNGNGTQGVIVRVHGNRFGNPVTCELSSWSATGNIIETNAASTTSNAATNLALDVNVSTNDGYYTIACELPPFGGIYSYQVTEF